MTEAIPGAAQYRRYRQLDSLRGIAAFTVFFGHYSSLKVNQHFYDALAPTPIGILSNASAAVIFFFVLSGFVLSLPFVDGKKSLSLPEFYIKRVFRIYPAFVFAIILSVLLKEFAFDKNGMMPFSEGIRGFWRWNLDKATLKELLKTLLLIGPRFNENLVDQVIWTLILEMKISIILPFFILIVSRCGVAFNIFFLFVITAMTYEQQWVLPVFYLGILLAKYKGQLISIVSRWPVAYTCAAFVVGIFLYNNLLEFLHFYMNPKTSGKMIICNYLIAAGSGIIMILIIAREKISRFFEKRIFIFLGNVSYSFYLIHLPLLLVMASLFSDRFSHSLLYIFLATLISSFAIGYLMFTFIEVPFQRLAARLVKRYRILGALRI